MRIGLRLNAPSGSGSSWSANAPSLAEFSSTFNMLSRAVFLRRPRIFVLPSPTLRQAFHHTINNMSAIKKVVLTDKAPPPIKGVYNQAIVANGTVYCSGQIGTDPATGKIVEVIADIKDFKAMNEVYMQYWGETKPARSCVQAQPPIAGLPVEIECIAVMP
ncbi:hypothetical protein LTR03_008496 [Friedmanniomyces endolithicus]|nr:hypothetical protein LTR03_008496 [Friedmanniomyces endolithicus]